MSCTDSIVPENLDFCPTEEVAGGTGNVDIYFAEHADFDTIASPAALDAALSYEEAGSVTAGHTFTAPKGFKKLEILPDTGIVENTIQGEKGSKSFANMFTGTIPGTTARNLGFMRRHKNSGMIFLIPERSGRYRQLGSKLNPAYIEESNGTTGAKAEDVNGIPFKISDVQAYPSPVYTGTITEFTPA